MPVGIFFAREETGQGITQDLTLSLVRGAVSDSRLYVKFL